MLIVVINKVWTPVPNINPVVGGSPHSIDQCLILEVRPQAKNFMRIRWVPTWMSFLRPNREGISRDMRKLARTPLTSKKKKISIPIKMNGITWCLEPLHLQLFGIVAQTISLSIKVFKKIPSHKNYLHWEENYYYTNQES